MSALEGAAVRSKRLSSCAVKLVLKTQVDAVAREPSSALLLPPTALLFEKSSALILLLLVHSTVGGLKEEWVVLRPTAADGISPSASAEPKDMKYRMSWLDGGSWTATETGCKRLEASSKVSPEQKRCAVENNMAAKNTCDKR
jgi:hypothetical protein